MLVTFGTPGLSMGWFQIGGHAGASLAGKMVKREICGSDPRSSTGGVRLTTAMIVGSGARIGLAYQVVGCAGFRLEVVALGDVLVRLVAEHSSATSRARADLLLALVVPSKLPPCGMLG